MDAVDSKTKSGVAVASPDLDLSPQGEPQLQFQSGVPSGQGERFSMSGEARAKLSSWMAQLEFEYGDLIRITKSDVLGHVIGNAPAHLSRDDLAALAYSAYDEMYWVTKALAKVKESKRQGMAITFESLMAKRPIAPPISVTENIRRPRRKNSADINDSDMGEQK